MANRIIIKEPYRRQGYSWGFDWPLQYGYLASLKAWLVWEWKTGVVKQMFPSEFNTHGFDFAESKARNASAAPHDPAINALHDMEA